MNSHSLRFLIVPGLASLMLTACMTDNDPAAREEKTGAVALDINPPVTVTEINFQNAAALDRLPLWPFVNKVNFPAYVQSIGPGASMEVFVSMGPVDPEFPDEDGDTSSVYAIAWPNLCRTLGGILGHRVNGSCVSTPANINRYHEAEFGSDWLGAKAYSPSGVRKLFSLTKIRVRGSVSIVLWYKTSSDAWKSFTLAPGYHTLTGTNWIKEFHLRSISGHPLLRYSVDDIQIRYSP